jgi:Fe-S-cluster containining protein
MTSCTCEHCISACENNPGMGTPDEMRKLIDLGYANKLCIDWWEPSFELDNDERIFMLVPAALGTEGGYSEEMPSMGWLFDWRKGQCTFLTEDDRCAIHEHKPTECREFLACRGKKANRAKIVRQWNTPKGQTLVREWKTLMGLD